MPRPLRLQLAGGIFHITCRGNRRERIFLDTRDYLRFLAILGDVVARFGWDCHTYCLMPNHAHLLIETPRENLSEGMQRLNSLYAQYFNRRYDLIGHLFQGRFYSELVQRDAHLLEAIRYIVLNPVRAGLCTHAGQWRWSNYRAVVGAVPPPRFLRPDFVLSLFTDPVRSSRVAFAAFVDDG